MKAGRRDIVLIVLLFVAALVVRVRATAWLLDGPPRFPQGDDGDYYAIARSLVEHGVFGIDGAPTAYRMPLFSLFAAFWHSLLGVEPYAIMPVLLVLGALVPVGAYLLGRSVAGPVAGLLAGLLMVFDRDLAVYSGLYMTETLFCVTVIGGMLAAGRLRVTGSWRWAVATGLLFGCATIARANFGPFVAVALLWIVWNGRDRLRTAIGRAALVGAIVAALWAPWAARNYLVFGALIPFTTQGGNGYYGVYNELAAAQPFGLWHGLWISRPVPGGLDLPAQEVAADQLQRQLARDWIQANPQRALLLALMQPVQLWAPFCEDFISWMLTTLVGLPALALLAWRRRQPELVLWLGMMLTATAMAVASLAVARFAFPLRPFLAVAATLPIAGAVEALALLRRGRAPASVHAD